MKKSLLLLTALMALVLVSCDNKEKKVREFATNFATKVLDNDVRQLRMMIPGVDRVDSFSLDGYAADKVVIEKQDDGYNVKLTDNRSMVVKEDEQGNLKVDATFGIVSFDPDLFDFAVRTGWIDQYMDDATIADLLADYEFKEFMVDRITKELRGVALSVPFTLLYWAFPEDNQTITFEGVDLPARSTKSMSGSKRGVGEATETSIRLQFDEEWLPTLCLQIYKANGHEYEDWKKGNLK